MPLLVQAKAALLVPVIVVVPLVAIYSPLDSIVRLPNELLPDIDDLPKVPFA